VIGVSARPRPETPSLLPLSYSCPALKSRFGGNPPVLAPFVRELAQIRKFHALRKLFFWENYTFHALWRSLFWENGDLHAVWMTLFQRFRLSYTDILAQA